MKEFDIKITDTAIKQFRKAAAGEEHFPDAIRLGVKGGGCSGFMFNLEFILDKDIDPEEDIIHTIEDLKFVCDCFSMEYLKGTTVDFTSSLKETGFKFSGTKMSRSCGCGSSFTPG